MKHIHLQMCTIFFMGFGLSGIKAQVVLPASGGNISGDNGSVSYTVGQISYTTNTGTNGSAAQGVQQPYEIYVTGINEFPAVSLSYQAYPNPTTGRLVLDVEGAVNMQLSFRISDINGKILGKGEVAAGQTTIQMDEFRNGNYFLSVYNNNLEIKTFKIIKK